MNTAQTTSQSPAARLPRWRYASLLAMLAAAAGGAFWVGSRSWQEPVDNGGLVIDQKYLDLQDVWEESNFYWKLPVHNPSRSAVEITSFVASCTCVAIEPRALVIDPGETREVRLELDLAAAPREDNDGAGNWAFKASIAPQIRGVAAHQTGWMISGRVKQLLSVLPGEPKFGETLIRGAVFPTRSLKVTSAIPLEALRVECDPKQAESSVSGGPREFDVRVALNPHLPAGPFSVDLFLQPLQNSAGRLPRKRLRGEGFVHEEIEAAPSKVLLGALPLGETHRETVVLRALRPVKFTLERWHSPADIEVEEAPSLAHTPQELPYTLTQHVSRLGEQRTRVIFVARMDGGRAIEVPVDVVYHGVPRGARDAGHPRAK